MEQVIDLLTGRPQLGNWQEIKSKVRLVRLRPCDETFQNFTQILGGMTVKSPSSMGITVFLRARTKPRGDPNRKKSDTSKSNFPRELPSSMVLLLDLREAVSLRKMLACKLELEHQVVTCGRRGNKQKQSLAGRSRRTWRGRPGVA